MHAGMIHGQETASIRKDHWNDAKSKRPCRGWDHANESNVLRAMPLRREIRKKCRSGNHMNSADTLCNPDAVAISDALLDSTGVAINTRDFALFAEAFSLPHTVTTFDEKRVIETMEDLELVFNMNCDYFAAKRVTDIVRKCMSADFDGPDTVKAMHITHLMSGNQRVKDPYPGFSVIIRAEGIWRVSKSDYAVDADAGLTKALRKLSRNAQNATNDAG